MVGYFLLGAAGGFLLGLVFWLFILGLCNAAKRGDEGMEAMREKDAELLRGTRALVDELGAEMIAIMEEEGAR